MEGYHRSIWKKILYSAKKSKASAWGVAMSNSREIIVMQNLLNKSMSHLNFKYFNRFSRRKEKLTSTLPSGLLPWVFPILKTENFHTRSFFNQNTLELDSDRLWFPYLCWVPRPVEERHSLWFCLCANNEYDNINNLFYVESRKEGK